MLKRNISSPLECPISDYESETSSHLFGQCIYARKVWEGKDLAVVIQSELDSEMVDRLWSIWKFKGEVVEVSSYCVLVYVFCSEFICVSRYCETSCEDIS